MKTRSPQDVKLSWRHSRILYNDL